MTARNKNETDPGYVWSDEEVTVVEPAPTMHDIGTQWERDLLNGISSSDRHTREIKPKRILR